MVVAPGRSDKDQSSMLTTGYDKVQQLRHHQTLEPLRTANTSVMRAKLRNDHTNAVENHVQQRQGTAVPISSPMHIMSTNRNNERAARIMDMNSGLTSSNVLKIHPNNIKVGGPLPQPPMTAYMNDMSLSTPSSKMHSNYSKQKSFTPINQKEDDVHVQGLPSIQP